MLQKINETAEFLAPVIKGKATTAIILGSGLGTLAEEIRVEKEWNYCEIPNFPVSTVEGHDGKLIFGLLGETPVVAMKGRFHYYEGYSMKETTFPVRVFGALGITTLYVSNAAGGTNPDFFPGDLMVITDHINFLPEHPLRGRNLPCGPRFPDMSEAYDRQLIAKADRIAAECGIKLQHGVYLANSGPTYETPAEYRMYRQWGADAVGMSTVPEVIVARHQGMKVFGISVITNVPSRVAGETSHEEVQAAAASVGPRMSQLIKRMIND
jgi:purine-nucleoside phosphorylase